MTFKEFTHPQIQTFILTFIVGAVAGVGALLKTGDDVTVRVALARSLTSGILGASASAIWVLYPEASPITILGVSCALTSLGTDGLQMLSRSINPASGMRTNININSKE